MIVLWTDALLFLLFFSLSGLMLFMRGKAHLQRPLHALAINKTAMVSAVILVFFVAIALLDSIHFIPADDKNHEVISLIDDWATPLRTQTEKTYSAPLAIRLYSKEMVTLPNGTMVWDYPRLNFAGQHLQDPDHDYSADVLKKCAWGFAKGFLLSALCYAGFWAFAKLKYPKLFQHPSTAIVCLTIAMLVTLSYALIDLSQFYHVFGTDKVGEDVFYQTLKSIRTGLVIGTLTTLIMLPMAIGLGILAGFFQGWVDDVIQYVYTTLNAIPSVLLIAASILVVQVYIANHEEAFTSVVTRSDLRLLFLCMILGVTNWTGLCRLLRAETLKLREMDYVQAAQALGVSKGRILIRHILPNVMHIVLISVVLDFSSLVLAEAVLSYINIGVDPTTYSWGNMINGARLEMAREPIVWWSLSAAFVFMFALVLSANLFADAVQSAFDPQSVTRE